MATATSSPLQRFEFTTTDPQAAREFLDRTYGARLQLNRHHDGSCVAAVSRIDAGDFSSSEVTLPADLTFTVAGNDALVVGTTIEGTVEFDRDGTADRYAAGDVFVGNYPDADSLCRSHGLRSHVLMLPFRLLAKAAGVTADEAAVPPRLLSPNPAGAAGAAQWKNTVDFVDDLLGNPLAAAQPLLLGNAARLLAVTALAVFPNTLLHRDETAADRADSTQTVLRRAIAYIDAHHADPDISLADIAAAARVTPRAVQYAFRRHKGTTPTGYLRETRLARAHRDLVAADPASGDTVTSIAARWGFAHPGRFAGLYRRVYAQSPRTTLYE